jgi:hypothetical protein
MLVFTMGLGCSREPQLYPVSGTVEYKGQPVRFGTINFRAENGATGAAQIVDGKYRIPKEGGLLEGRYRVAINYPDPKIPPPTGAEAPGEILPNREMLPKKYNDETELEAEIKAQPSNDASFQLK